MTAIMRDDGEVRRFLGAVKAPTQLIWGMLDPVLPPDTLELLAGRLSSSEVRVDRLDDVNHYPPLEAPEEVAEVTRQFLGAVTSASENTRVSQSRAIGFSESPDSSHRQERGNAHADY